MTGPGLAEMNAFVAIAEQRSFAKAAVRLGLSPSTLSETLRRLEERLGVRLIERTTRSVVPTEAGERLLARLRPVLEDYEAAHEFDQRFPRHAVGIVTPHRRAAGRRSGALAAAGAVRRAVSRDPARDLGRRRPDRHRGRPVRRGIASWRTARAGHDRTAGDRGTAPDVVASRAYLERRGRPKTPQDLKSHNCIRIRLSSGAVLPWRFVREGRPIEGAVEGTLVVNDLVLAIRAMRDGAGLLHLPHAYFEEGIAAGELESVLDDWMPSRGDAFFLYYSSRRQIRAPLQAFLDFLRQNMKVRRHQVRQ